jgi:hypothetical protein
MLKIFSLKMDLFIYNLIYQKFLKVIQLDQFKFNYHIQFIVKNIIQE